MVFTESCEAIPLLMRLMSDEACADGAEINRYHVHHLTQHFATAFLLSELQGNTAATDALVPEAITQTDITYTAQGF